MKAIYGLVIACFLLSAPVFAGPKGEIPGVKGPFVNFVAGKIMVTMLLTEVELDGGVELKIPRTINSSASIEPNVEDGGSMVTLKIDYEDIKKALNVELGDPQLLPCGRPIPGIPSGALKDAIRVDLPKENYNLSFYFHKKLFGTYIPFNFDIPLSGPLSITLKWKGTNIGALALVPNQGDKRAAGTIFLRIDAFKDNKEIMKLLDPENF